MKTPCVDTQGTLQREADKDVIFARCISRFPPDFYIGVRQNRLGELFAPGVENGFAVWVQSAPGKTHFALRIWRLRSAQVVD